MAGLTSTFPFRPTLPYRSKPLSLSSFHSNLFGLRLCSPNSSNLSLVISAPRVSISADYGDDDDDDGFSESNSDEDEELDMSTIRSENVRLIDEKHNMVGIVSKSVAAQMAEDAELDLVILSPDADPPVVKIMDYSKYKYELQKKKRDQQKKAHRMALKELKMGYNIDVHDYSVRLKAAQKFLKEGDKVKVIVNLKGRENQFRNNAIELLKRFQNDIGELAVEESKNLKERNIYLVLVPNKVVLQKAQGLPKEKEKSTAAAG